MCTAPSHLHARCLKEILYVPRLKLTVLLPNIDAIALLASVHEEVVTFTVLRILLLDLVINGTYSVKIRPTENRNYFARWRFQYGTQILFLSLSGTVCRLQ